MASSPIRDSALSSSPPPQIGARAWGRFGLLGLAGLFYALHFLHLRADFPSNPAWIDWSRYTDEGWYSDAAVRQSLFGQWYLPGDFNPAVALPIWPLLEVLIFHLFGPSLVTARALTVAVFGVMLLAVYGLLSRTEERTGSSVNTSLAAPFALVFLTTSPFFYAFERMAILEPLLAALTSLAMLCALGLRIPQSGRPRRFAAGLATLWPSVALGLLLPAMVFTKPTALALLPALLFLIWVRAAYRLLPALRLAWPSGVLGAAVWLVYYFGFVRPHFLEDFQYLFTANNYTGFQMEPLAGVIFHTIANGLWIGAVLYPLFFVLLVYLAMTRPRFFRKPLVPALLLWILGYFAFLGYHNNLQARYYLLLALPITMLVALALDDLLQPNSYKNSYKSPQRRPWLRPAAVALCVMAIAVPDALQQIGFLLHPAYTFIDAAAAIARRVRTEPAHSPLLLSVSGSDLTLMTGLPSINTEFGTLDLDERIRQYRPGWYVAWNETEDEDMKAIAPLYQPVLVGTYPAMDDPDRNLLLLYRLDPAHSHRPPSPENHGRFGKPRGTGHHGRSADHAPAKQ